MVVVANGCELLTPQALERLYDEGRAMAIGVSNFTVAHLTELAPYTRVPIHVNQVELHPLCQQLSCASFVFCFSKMFIAR